MALHGNPFLGKLKIPAPDLSRIPETPFEGTPLKSGEPSLSTPSQKGSTVKEDRVQTGSVTGSKSINKPPAFGELAVLRYFADREGIAGSPIYTRRREIAAGTFQTINGVKTALRRLRETNLIQLNATDTAEQVKEETKEKVQKAEVATEKAAKKGLNEIADELNALSKKIRGLIKEENKKKKTTK